MTSKDPNHEDGQIIIIIGLHFIILQKTGILIKVDYFFLQAAKQIKLLYKLFLKVDATQVEINPFGETLDGKGGLFS